MTVAIIGGGIAGLAAAVALRQRGIEATVYEQAPALRELGAGIALWPNATRALRSLGVLDAVAERSGRAEVIHILDASGHALVRFSTARPDVPSLCVRRSHLVAALADALDTDAIRYGKTFERATPLADGVSIRFADGAEIQAGVLVGADGMRSAVRDALVEPVTPTYRGYTAWRGVGPHPSDLDGDAFEAWGDRQRFGLFGLGNGLAYWYALSERPADRHAAADRDEVADLYRDWHPRAASVIEATDPDEITRHDVYDRPLAQRWVSGRVAVVGDAAHAMTPALGQGGAQALEDAVALAGHLVSGQPAGAALLAFEQDRKRRASSVAWLSRTSARLGQLGGRMARVRNAVARATPSRLFEAGFTSPF